MSKIRILPDQIINQIAAGEVVERPASVLKELTENAVDAGSRKIIIRFRHGGKSLLQVSDDGTGMDREDALLALERHATSKVSSFEDVVRLRTMGFRGEALPSIAAVSRMELRTSVDDREGVKVLAEGGKIIDVQPFAGPKGTTVTVKDLFYNVPARRKFLRTPSTESRHVWKVLQGLILPNRQISFQVYADDRLVGDYPDTGSVEERITGLYGESLGGDLRHYDYEAEGTRAVLFLAREHSSFHGADIQYTFINGRMVRDRLLSGSFHKRLKNCLPHHSHPAYFLFFSMDEALVDFNVHPAKLEVRFRDLNALYGVLDTIVQGVGGKIVSPRPIHIEHPGSGHGFTGQKITASLNLFKEQLKEYRQERMTGEEGFHYLGQYADSFLLFSHGDELRIVDQHAAHERVLYEQMLKSRSLDHGTDSQGLIPPLSVELTPDEAAGIEESIQALNELAFNVELFGDRSMMVRFHPRSMQKDEVSEFVRAFLSERRISSGPERLTASLACRAAIKIRKTATPDEAISLYRNLMKCDDSQHCPHGRPTTLSLSIDQLLKHFRRT